MTHPLHPKALEEEPVILTKSGKHDARCQVCREPINVSWFRDEAPPGGCQEGHTKAHECRTAMNRAHNTALTMKLRAEGVLK